MDKHCSFKQTFKNTVVKVIRHWALPTQFLSLSLKKAINLGHRDNLHKFDTNRRGFY